MKNLRWQIAVLVAMSACLAGCDSCNELVPDEAWKPFGGVSTRGVCYRPPWKQVLPGVPRKW